MIRIPLSGWIIQPPQEVPYPGVSLSENKYPQRNNGGDFATLAPSP
jgi:hypothetical protein